MIIYINYFHISRILNTAFFERTRICRPLSIGCFRTCSKRIGSFICSARASSITFETIYAIFIFLLNVALTSPAQDINDYVLNSHVSRDTLTDLSREAVSGYFTYTIKLNLRRFIGSDVTMRALGSGCPALICRRTDRVIRSVNRLARGQQSVSQSGATIIS